MNTKRALVAFTSILSLGILAPQGAAFAQRNEVIDSEILTVRPGPRPDRPGNPRNPPANPGRPDRPGDRDRDRRPNPPPYNPPPNRPQPPPYRPTPPPYNPPPSRPYPPPYRPAPPPDYNYGYAKKLFLNRWVRNETLPLRQLLDLDRSYYGEVVRGVEVRLKEGYAYGDHLQLLVNDIVNDSDRAPGRHSYLRVRGYQELGRDIQTLRLRVNGEIFIEEITVFFERSGGHYDRNVDFADAYIGRWTNYNEAVDLSYMLNEYYHRGYRVDEISVEMDALDSVYSTAQILINGRPASQLETVSRFGMEHRFRIYSNEVGGRDLRGLQLQTQGQIFVGVVRIRLVRY